MKLGIDSGGTYLRYPEQFSALCSALMAAGHEVHIISGNLPPVMASILCERHWGTLPHTQCHANETECDVPAWKAETCKALGIDLFIDDHDPNIVAVISAGIACLKVIG